VKYVKFKTNFSIVLNYYEKRNA